jgi:hypothetical protein
VSAEESGGNAELNGLLMQAAAVDGDLAAQAPEAIAEQQAEMAVVSLAEENSKTVGMILGLAVPILSRLYPSLAEVYTEEACCAVAASLGPLLAKYNINIAEWGGRYQEEIGAAFVCGPIAWATVQGVKADIQSRIGAAKAIENGQPAPPISAPAPAAAKNLKPGDYGYVERQAATVDSMTEFPGA